MQMRPCPNSFSGISEQVQVAKLQASVCRSQTEFNANLCCTPLIVAQRRINEQMNSFASAEIYSSPEQNALFWRSRIEKESSKNED